MLRKLMLAFPAVAIIALSVPDQEIIRSGQYIHQIQGSKIRNCPNGKHWDWRAKKCTD